MDIPVREKKPANSNHKWWHFVYGKEWRSEDVFKSEKIHTTNCWYSCKKCGEQIGEKSGFTHFGPFTVEIKLDK